MPALSTASLGDQEQEAVPLFVAFLCLEPPMETDTSNPSAPGNALKRDIFAALNSVRCSGSFACLNRFYHRLENGKTFPLSFRMPRMVDEIRRF